MDPAPPCERCAALEEIINTRFLTDRLYRLVQSALSQTISVHGPITRGFLPSASKRVTQSIRNSLREMLKMEHDEQGSGGVVAPGRQSGRVAPDGQISSGG